MVRAYRRSSDGRRLTRVEFYIRYLECIIEREIDRGKPSRRMLKHANDPAMEEYFRDQLVMAATLFGRRLAEMMQWLENEPEQTISRVKHQPVARHILKRRRRT